MFGRIWESVQLYSRTERPAVPALETAGFSASAWSGSSNTCPQSPLQVWTDSWAAFRSRETGPVGTCFGLHLSQHCQALRHLPKCTEKKACTCFYLLQLRWVTVLSVILIQLPEFANDHRSLNGGMSSASSFREEKLVGGGVPFLTEIHLRGGAYHWPRLHGHWPHPLDWATRFPSHFQHCKGKKIKNGRKGCSTHAQPCYI